MSQPTEPHGDRSREGVACTECVRLVPAGDERCAAGVAGEAHDPTERERDGVRVLMVGVRAGEPERRDRHDHLERMGRPVRFPVDPQRQQSARLHVAEHDVDLRQEPSPFVGLRAADGERAFARVDIGDLICGHRVGETGVGMNDVRAVAPKEPTGKPGCVSAGQFEDAHAAQWGNLRHGRTVGTPTLREHIDAGQTLRTKTADGGVRPRSWSCGYSDRVRS